LALKTLDEYARHVMELENAKSTLRDRTVSEPRKVKVNGTDAIVYEIRGTLKDAKLVYLKTFIESANRWNQLTCFTTPSHLDDATADFNLIAESFKEIPKR
jgi:hypothetical protein